VKTRAAAKAAGAEVLLLDGGDVWRGTPEGDLTRGDLVVEAFGRLGYDAVAFGNHELDMGVSNAARLAKAAPFPWISANVIETATGLPPAWLRTHVIVERGGLRIGIVGMTPPETASIVMGADRMGLEFLSPAAAAKAQAKALEGKTDVLLFLTHLGPEKDLTVLDAAPRARLVVGGHSHTRLFKPVLGGPDKGAWIVQAGTACVVVGRVRLKVSRATKEVVLEDYTLTPLAIERVGRDAEMAAFLEERLSKDPVLVALGATIATLTADAPKQGRTPWSSSAAGNLVADATRAAVDADVALGNRGGVRTAIPKGPVTGRDVFRLMPFDNTIVVVPMTGAELLSALEFSIAGPRISPLEVSGLTLRFHVEGTGEHARASGARVEVGGAPLDPAKTYRVAVNSYLAQGGAPSATSAGQGRTQASSCATRSGVAQARHDARRDGAWAPTTRRQPRELRRRGRVRACGRSDTPGAVR
jgi:2',3'-cyclic-nucleotide 2'-phosphodiesterase (5'-nucleotidase family)